MGTFWAAVVVVGIALFLLCFNLIFRKGKSFPDGEIGHNKELRKRGVICAKEDERTIWGDKACSSCEIDCTLKNLIKEKK